ncbi:pyrroline-5-carboxylate reductase [Corynebacterium halotolerans]|uniref:Pyrroline-5-carboxylate reductase n=1 Tax=Corynebacterium halotolerans YIM 70093 = DSM 44683 TaxID=1121362 RepID=M1P438_9CORY|nr:pyrroline-5-carboxylate reductase [Corynebacterium halotolerans]AGF71416.1 pyrroline-5-carboxylate reductase [Corynebacterium halotolerans YIM 70093 = DSM 44683]
MTTIAVLGGGKIGEALISGLIAAGTAPQSINVTNRRAERGQELRETYGIHDLTDNRQAVEGADVVFLCVKPKGIPALLTEIADTIDGNDVSTVVVSMAAGIPLAAMEDALVAGTPVVRVMPNTPMLVGKGMNAVAPGRFVNEEQLDVVARLLGSVGDVVNVAESDLDAVTAMSGSSPAYFFLVAEALIDAGVSLGLTRDVAQKLVTSSAAGAGAMLAESGIDPTTLRANVSSPAGTTVAALRELEESGIRGAFFRAAEACATRSAELGAPATPEK